MAELPGDISGVSAAEVDHSAVYRFAADMETRLEEKRAAGKSGWRDLPASYLSQRLLANLAKGNLLDVANYCMMLHLNGQAFDQGETRDGTYHPLKNIDTWRKGCSCAVREPGECLECTDGLIDAIERWFLAGGTSGGYARRCHHPECRSR